MRKIKQSEYQYLSLSGITSFTNHSTNIWGIKKLNHGKVPGKTCNHEMVS